MGEVLVYRDELTKAMQLLAREPHSLFIGQGVIHADVTPILETLKLVPLEQRLELPVFENTQMGMAIGLALLGFLPISIYARMDFLILAADQLINHLDKFEELSAGEYKPKVIIRTSVGAQTPLYPGPQHCQNHTCMLRAALSTIEVIELTEAIQIVPEYQRILQGTESAILVEFAEMMSK